MKKSALPKLVGFHLRMRPILRRFDQFGELEPEDDRWLVQRANPATSLEVLDIRTHHVLRIPPDHIHEFRQDPFPYFPGINTGFLMLRSQIWLQGMNAGLEPLDWSHGHRS